MDLVQFDIIERDNKIFQQQTTQTEKDVINECNSILKPYFERLITFNAVKMTKINVNLKLNDCLIKGLLMLTQDLKG